MTQEAPKSLTEVEVKTLLEELKQHKDTDIARYRSHRNVLAALLMVDGGLRIGEVLGLTISDLVIADQAATGLLVRAEITKTGCERTVPLTYRIRSFIEYCRTSLWNRVDSFMHCPAFAKLNSTTAMTTQHLERIIKVAGQKSLHRDIHPHMLRHTFATRLMKVTNARVVQQLLGHKRMSSTQIYCHPDQTDLDAAIHGLNY